MSLRHQVADGKRRRGTRRWCIRCRMRQDEFAHVRNSQCGVCVRCVRPDDDFPVVEGPKVDMEKRRAELRAQIEVLMSTPLTGAPVSEAAREQVRRDVERSRWASAWDGSELIDLGGE